MRNSSSSKAEAARGFLFNITMPAQLRIHLSPFTKDDRGQVSQWLQYFWRAFAQTFHAMRMQTPYAGVHWLQSVKRQWRCISSKTVLYTGSVFEYIRAWRFQTSGTRPKQDDEASPAHTHEQGDDWDRGVVGAANCFQIF